MPDFLQKENPSENVYLNAKECLNILTDIEKKELVNNKTDVEFETGETLVKRGFTASNVLYLNEGLVRLEFINDGKPYTIALIQPHSFIGIVCCFAFKNFDFTAVALERSKVSFIDITVFEKFIKNNGEFAFNLIKHMSGVSNVLIHRITSFSQKNINGALSLLLLDFINIYKSRSFTISITRKEIANILGYSKESVINTLSKFNKEGIIKIADRNIEILNVEKLKQISRVG